MIDGDGHRRQEQLREHPAFQDMLAFAYPLKGSISKVYYKDNENNRTKQTVVDVLLLGGMPMLTGVPISTPKANSTSGEEWTPEEGDVVVVQFINGRWTEPVVTGFLNMPDNMLQATSAEAPAGTRRYHKRCNKTSEKIDKDGNRDVFVNKNDTTIIKGKKDVTVQTGDITITVSSGKCTVSISGKTSWTSAGIDLDGGGALSGVVTKQCICALTGLPHPQASTTVKASI